jgi:hypothetical protein
MVFIVHKLDTRGRRSFYGYASGCLPSRVGLVSNSDELLCQMLSRQRPDGRRGMLWDEEFIWQSAVGLLECSIYFWLGGFAVFLCDIVGVHGKESILLIGL